MTARTQKSKAQPQFRREATVVETLIAKHGICRDEHLELFSDFLGDAGQTLPAPLKATKVGTSTNNEVDYVAGANGVFALTHSADSEAQTMRIDCGDTLPINMSKNPRFACRLKVDLAGAALTADQRIVVGLASAYDATLDDVVTNAWFKIEGAVLTLFAESDDGTTDDDDNDTGEVFVDGTYIVLEIDAADLSAVEFYVDGVKTHELDMSDLGADTLVQPMIAIQRDAGTEADVVSVDYLRCTWER